MIPSERVALEAEVTIVRAMERIAMAMDEFEVTDQLYNDYRAVVNLIPECPSHGSDCLPHARRWIADQIIRAGEGDR